VSVVWAWLRQNPIVVDLGQRPEPTRDISIDVVLGIFALAGAFLLAAAIGAVLVAAGMFLYKRHRDAASPGEGGPSHTRLQL
jgi:hypothetical protein